MEAPLHPGRILKERFLDPLGISPYSLAQHIGVHVSRISKIIQGERSLTADTAVRLGLFFEVPASWWMDMQARYDLAQVDVERLRGEVRPYPKRKDAAIYPTHAQPLPPDRQAPEPAPTVIPISQGLLERLRRQAAVEGDKPAPARELVPVTYEGGFHGLETRESKG